MFSRTFSNTKIVCSDLLLFFLMLCPFTDACLQLFDSDCGEQLAFLLETFLYSQLP